MTLIKPTDSPDLVIYFVVNAARDINELTASTSSPTVKPALVGNIKNVKEQIHRGTSGIVVKVAARQNK